jgi:hypothetical protein
MTNRRCHYCNRTSLLGCKFRKRKLRYACSPEGSAIYVPGSGNAVTLDHVAPEFVDFHSPFPERAPKYKMLLLLGSIASRSPRPRPGMFPPSLNDRLYLVHVFPWSVDLKILPLLGSQLFVYMPTARYTIFGFTGSVAKASIPQSCL